MATYSCIYPPGYTLSAEEQDKYLTGRRFTRMVDYIRAIQSLQDDEICEIIGGDEQYNWATSGPDTAQSHLTDSWADNGYSCTIRAVGTARHNGAWSDAAYRMDGQYYYGGISGWAVKRVMFDGFQIRNAHPTRSTPCIGHIFTGANNSYIKIHNMIFESDGLSPAYALNLGTYSLGTVEIINSIFRGFKNSSGSGTSVINIRSAAQRIYNNVFQDCGDAYSRVISGLPEMVGNVFINVDKQATGTYTIPVNRYNASDADKSWGDNPINPSGGDWGNEFVDYASGDYRLKATGNLYQAVPLAAYEDPSALVRDIAGNPRDINAGAISAGAFEYVHDEPKIFIAESSWHILNKFITASSWDIIASYPDTSLPLKTIKPGRVQIFSISPGRKNADTFSIVPRSKIGNFTINPKRR